ncbi:MAG TPA: BON domain-containing protein [Bryobacteraceae bacterium]|nr:BON domain-containing protein [Bryobacteraceae bacterium]
MRSLLLLVLVCLPIWSAAASARNSHKPAAPHTRAVPDSQIEAAIRARFERSKISTNHFQVRVQGGIATLEGRTDVIQHKGTATRLAKSAGAMQVVNRIQVSQAARERAASNLAKGRRRAQVKRGEIRDTR